VIFGVSEVFLPFSAVS